MAAGRISPISAGFGFWEAISIGDRPGCHGEPGATTSAGHLCLHAGRELFMRDNLSALASISNTISDRNITTFVTSVSSVNRSCEIESFRQRRTLPTLLTP